ncbi:MAG TPA: XdhC family protein [Firmicutes bacterium]|jgi:xanthine dehydrogenase accessory factor|nr:XdhC family protein [Bacillota bacterium]
MKQLYESCARLLSKGEDLVMATIIQKDGSAPRTAGTKMLIREDGSFEGTIGGGILEARVLELARDVFKSRQSNCEKFIFTSDVIDSLDMICGGEAEVFVDLLSSTFQENIALYQSLAELSDDRQTALLISKIITGDESRNSLKQCLLLEDKTIGMQLTGGQKEQLLQLARSRLPMLVTLEGMDYWVEPLGNPSTVYLFGAGHVSRRIAQLTGFVGFRTVVLDDRAEFASKNRFPWAEKIFVLEDFAGCVPDLPIDEDSYLVIVSRGHKADMIILEQALKTGAAYIGMIGSIKKRDTIYQLLREKGVSEEKLAKVYSPIGLPIKAETPEEIAISIVAELIRARAEKKNSR